MKTLKLDHDQALQIEQGLKHSTWRMYDDKDLSVNDEVIFIDKVEPEEKSTWRPIGTFKIDSVTQKRLGDITEYDVEKYTDGININQAIKLMGQFYGPLATKDAPVKMIDFTKIDNADKSANVVTEATKITEVKLYTDGGSRGNPGPSALGYAILDNNDITLAQGSKYLGITTNNQAEYQAVREGLLRAKDFTNLTVSVYLDSQLVAHQMNGVYKIKNRELWPIHQSIKQICEQEFKKVTFTYIPRELNKQADAMVNKCLDETQALN